MNLKKKRLNKKHITGLDKIRREWVVRYKKLENPISLFKWMTKETKKLREKYEPKTSKERKK